MFEHKLMHNNFSKEDFKKVSNFLLKKDKNKILTQSIYVEKFEKLWSKWLGTKYSVFVNSGSSANLLTMTCLKSILKENDEIIVPTLTWPSDIMAVILNNFKPVFVDINLENLGMNEDEIIKRVNRKTKAVFITHAQGFNSLSTRLINYLKKNKIILIEDVCESHGATFNKKKLGTYGLISNFSFYYAHHMSTIEGGMFCTNDKKIYHIAKMVRGHGMVRETKDYKLERTVSKKYPDLFDKFIFVHPGYNMRNNEISALIGINQLKRLNKNIDKRNINFKYFLSFIDKNIFFSEFNLLGSSNYAFPVILRKKSFKLRNKLESIMVKNKIQFRRGNAGGGNQLRQPYLKEYITKYDIKKDFRNVEHVHHFGYYIGNYPLLSKNKIMKICKILNSVKND